MSTSAATGEGEPAPAFPGSWFRDRRLGDTLAVLAALLFLGLVTRFGWLSDDAFISFRVTDNLLSGDGLVSNGGERVQAFTNPLWTLLMAVPYGLTGDIFASAIVLSLLCCAGTAAVIWRFHQGGWRTAWTLLLLATSFSFVTFSTSGLENSLAHLLLAGLFFVSTRRPTHTLGLWLLGALTILNRLDHALLVLPTLALSLSRDWRSQWRWCLLGLTPLFAWLLFAIVYYGFPYPNTAYAKLNVAISRIELTAQGLAYLIDSLLTDVLVLVTIGLSLLAAVWATPRSRTLLAHAVGIALYLLYICWVGGDFMSGRFLTAPFLVAVLLLSMNVERQPGAAVALAALALLAGQRLLSPMPVDIANHCPIPPSGIVDERSCYVEQTGIAQNVRVKKFKLHAYYQEGVKMRVAHRAVVVTTLVGLAGFAAGPGVHIVDPYALTDPLLARIKFKALGRWRPGHLPRPLPPGYTQSLERRENLIIEPCARALLSDLWLITRGPLFSTARWGAVLRRNLGDRTCEAS